MFVSWGYYSQPDGNNQNHVPNHQPDIYIYICIYICVYIYIYIYICIYIHYKPISDIHHNPHDIHHKYSAYRTCKATRLVGLGDDALRSAGPARSKVEPMGPPLGLTHYEKIYG